MVNRENRRAFKKASSGFNPPILGEWGDWKDHDYTQKVPLGVVPPKGITRFVSNDKYSVQFYPHQTEWGEVLQLLVRLHTGKPVRSWADMQRIKNELVGEDRTAIEVFPAESDLIDQANCYHLWVLPEGFKIPFGLHFKGWSAGIRGGAA